MTRLLPRPSSVESQKGAFILNKAFLHVLSFEIRFQELQK